MATSYSTLLGLALPVQGELSGTWGDTVNNYITNYLDAAVAGTQTLSTDADVTLTKTTGTALGATSSQYAVLNCTGARTAQRTITAPAASKFYIIVNGTTGGFAVKLVGAGPTTGITVANGYKALAVWNGSDFVVVSKSVIDLASEVTGTLPLGNGGTGGTSAATARSSLSVPSITEDQNSTSQILSSVAGTNTITGSLTPALTAYATGQTFRFVAAGTNTGAVTININGLGAKAITKNGTTALSGGDISINAAVQITYDGTQFQLVSGAGGGASAGGVLYENSRTLTSSYTITSSKSAHMVGPLTIASGQTLTVPTGEALMIFNPSTSGVGTTDVLTTGAQTFQGQKTFALFPNIAALPSMVRLNTTNGYGSTNTMIWRLTNVVVSQGSDITYADSATLGNSFTINTSGVYALHASMSLAGAGVFGFSLNSTQLTTQIEAINIADRLVTGSVSGANLAYCAAGTFYLAAGSVVRLHGDTTATGTKPALVTITRVA